MKGLFSKPVANKAAGFSLVELMIVVSIIGILAALAVPRFTKFQAKARQSEARTNLSHIYTLQMSQHAENSQYEFFSRAVNGTTCSETKIGFQVEPCSAAKVRYEYSVTSADADTFTAQATADGKVIVPNCQGGAKDTWTINQSKLLQSTSNAVLRCT